MPPFIDIIEKNIRETQRLMPGSVPVRENLFGGWLKKNNRTLADLRRSPVGNNYSLARTCCDSIMIGLLLAGGMSPEDVFDPRKGRREKDELADEVLGKMYAADQAGNWIEDYEWTTRTIQKAVRGVTGAFERMARGTELSSLPGVMQPKNAAFLSIGHACYDLYQEMLRSPEKTGPYREPDFPELEDRSAMLGKLIYPLESGYLGSVRMVDPSELLSLQLSRFVSGTLALRHVRERLAQDKKCTVYEAYREVAEPLYMMQQELAADPFADEMAEDPELCEAFSYSVAAGLLEEHLVDDGPMDDPARKPKLLLEGVDIFAAPERAKELLIRNELLAAGLTEADARRLAEAAGMSFGEYLAQMRAEELAAEAAPVQSISAGSAAPTAIDGLFAQRSELNKTLRAMVLTSDELRENLFREQLGKHGLSLETMGASHPSGCPYSVGRSACTTLTIGLLLADGMPLEDVFDPEKGRAKKAEIAGEVVDKMLAVGPDKKWIADLDWVGKRMQRAARGFIRTFDEKMKTIDLSQPGMVYRRENAQLLLMCTSMHDLMQEIEKKSDGRRGTHYLIEGTIEPDFEENREKLRRAGFFSSMAAQASSSPETLRGNNASAYMLGNIVMIERMRRNLDEQRKNAPAGTAFSDVLLQLPEPRGNSYGNEQFVQNGLRDAMAHDPSYAKAFAEAAVTGQLAKHLTFSQEAQGANDPPAHVILQGIDVLEQPEKARELFFMDAHDLTYADVARLKQTHDVDLLEKPELVSQLLTLEELGLTMGEVRELAKAKRITVQAYLDGIVAQNAAAEQALNDPAAEEPAQEVRFETLGDVERFIDSHRPKSVEQMVSAIRALNTISENSPSNVYACYQAGELVNTLGAALMARLREDPDHASVFTKSDIKRTEGTMNRHHSAAKKMKTATTLKKEDSEKLLKDVMKTK